MTKNNLRRIDISRDINQKYGLSISYSKKIVQDLLDAFLEQIKNNKLVFKNIGSFKLIDKKQRIGRNPKSKKEFVISARKSISFKPAKNLKNLING